MVPIPYYHTLLDLRVTYLCLRHPLVFRQAEGSLDTFSLSDALVPSEPHLAGGWFPDVAHCIGRRTSRDTAMPPSQMCVVLSSCRYPCRPHLYCCRSRVIWVSTTSHPCSSWVLVLGSIGKQHVGSAVWFDLYESPG